MPFLLYAPGIPRRYHRVELENVGRTGGAGSRLGLGRGNPFSDGERRDPDRPPADGGDAVDVGDVGDVGE